MTQLDYLGQFKLSILHVRQAFPENLTHHDIVTRYIKKPRGRWLCNPQISTYV